MEQCVKANTEANTLHHSEGWVRQDQRHRPSQRKQTAIEGEMRGASG